MENTCQVERWRLADESQLERRSLRAVSAAVRLPSENNPPQPA